ncbi:MAG: excinuclease ABC subunit UvrC [Acidobacteriota bacterium]|nr:excinuclease ABC subunit UvrC [Acidobacteriota bacterium]
MKPLSPELEQKLARLPDSPGCYRFLDGKGRVLYVGKAKSLRARVRSYFQPSAQHPPRTLALVAEIRDLDLILTSSEVEALILENNLIKEHRPRYNVLLRDDKSFPYLRLTTSEAFPRVQLVRRPRAGKDPTYGPFLPASHARRTLRLIPRFFQVANCHLPFDGRQRPCLYYHLDQCLAPCAGKADPAEYAARVEEAKLFLEGRNEELVAVLRRQMEAASAELAFERAARLRDMIASIESLASRPQMTSVGLEDIDFWSEYRVRDQAAVELFRMRGGRVIGRREFTFDPAPPPESFYDLLLARFYADQEVPREIVLPRFPADRQLIERFLDHRAGHRVRLAAVRSGERRRFLDLVSANAKMLFEARFRSPHAHGVQAIEGLRDLLGLDAAPFRIEGFDISHFQGEAPRASMVVFEGGRPKKADYRIYAIRTAVGGDDYQALREVVRRRYGRLLREGRRLPDLVLIDGGRGQLAAARQALSELGLDSLAAAGLAKREEEIFLPDQAAPLLLDRAEPALRLLQQVRDEAHRFALHHHRKARRRSRLKSELTEVPGVGPVTARRLLEQFGSVRAVREASLEALSGAIGPVRARRLREALDAGDAGSGRRRPSKG